MNKIKSVNPLAMQLLAQCRKLQLYSHKPENYLCWSKGMACTVHWSISNDFGWE